VRPQLPELSGHELLAEWRKVMDAAAASLNSVGDHVEAPQQLVETMRRQLELVQELVARERRLQQQAASQLLAPIDAVFDLLETSGTTLRKQAEALESAGQALEESARLVKTQAELFERAIGALRGPSDRARAIAGLKPRASRSAPRNNRRRPRTAEK
jgi:ABC-type transporter Mla subunit MlaD